MYEVVFSPEAEAHLLSLFAYIAEAASPEIAANYTDAIMEQCESLRTFPSRGAMTSGQGCVSSGSAGESPSPSKSREKL